ncbi:hypothetical protein NHP21005_17470 [Helicobacter sp. NHP21005]|uniref:hypothetical protein n=1 Tax=Helicobacter felistomachi TaxID=3040201 RepID=UPI0025723C40|nr:hypothetical protein [Helicobacter sp. NHP21005]BEG58059.1 hypothetical protein NHP21005_17470 [Helicobacter sp. NHP21005]
MLADAIINELKPFRKHFQRHGSDLEIDNGARETLIVQAMQEETGMRAIKTLLAQTIHYLRFDMKAWEGFVCVVTEETIIK